MTDHENPGSVQTNDHEAFAAKLLEQFRQRMRGVLPPRAVEMSIDAKIGIATIPINGEIAYRADDAGRDGTSIEHIRADLARAMADDRVRCILLDADSGGGVASGTDELCAELRAAREQKPIVAHSDTFVLSCAYKLAAQANRICATEKAVIGGIGAKIEFFDPAQDYALVEIGSPGKRVDGRSCDAAARFLESGCAIPTADRAAMQRIVDGGHAKFVEAIAAGLCITLAAARRLADGCLYVGNEAVARGLLDGIATREFAIEVARRLAGERAATTTNTPAPSAGDDNERNHQ